MPITHWAAEEQNEAALAALQKSGLGRLVSHVLSSRGITTPEAANAFISGENTFFDPFLMNGMDSAVAIIEGEMLSGGLIVIYGDYDCDGMTATALLYSYLEERGANVAYYIPDRDDEGYGLNMSACDVLKQNGAKLIITVDNGISAHEELRYLTSLGIKTVVSDHHTPPAAPAPADVVLNPHLPGCGYPYAELSGVGVAAKLVCALEGDMDCVDTVSRFGDLICLGTVADVVPLTGENRALVRVGLLSLAQSERPGIAALLAVAGCEDKPLDAQSVAFTLCPRLNAASRMGQCEKSVELLLCEDPTEAARLAGEINELNTARRAREGEITLAIEKRLLEQPELLLDRVLVLWGEGWHSGVIGIAAARMCERYGKPCLLISVSGREGRGSARTVGSFSIIEAITACAPLLTRFGGHPSAAGFSLLAENLPELRRKINLVAGETHAQMPVRELAIDGEAGESELSVQSVSQLSVLEPFGAGNSLPVFLLECTLLGIIPTSDGRHLRLRLMVGTSQHTAVLFNQTARQFPYKAGERLCAAVALSISQYKGQSQLSIQIKDIRPSGFCEEEYFSSRLLEERFSRGEELRSAEKEKMLPTREETALVYRAIKAQSLPDDAEHLFLALHSAGGLPLCRVSAAVEALREAGLIETREGALTAPPTSAKVDLMKTSVFVRLSGG